MKKLNQELNEIVELSRPEREKKKMKQRDTTKRTLMATEKKFLVRSFVSRKKLRCKVKLIAVISSTLILYKARHNECALSVKT